MFQVADAPSVDAGDDSGAQSPVSSAAPVKPQPSATPNNTLPAVLPLVWVKVIGAEAPFPQLALVKLQVRPLAGDVLVIDIGGRLANYRVKWVKLNPFDQVAHVSAGCLPNDDNIESKLTGDQNDLKRKMDDYISSNVKIFDRADTYSKAILLGGYAGLLAIWSYCKDILTHKSTAIIGLSIGLSLFLYISWQIYTTIYMQKRHLQFHKLIERDPSSFFVELEKFNESNKKESAHFVKYWAILLWPTVIFGYLGAFMLFLNCALKILEIPPWP